MRRINLGAIIRTIAPLLLMLWLPVISPAYSVLTHEAIIDATWDSSIKPLLVKRFRSASAEELRKARAYAYGGAIIQDMGYYPFGSQLFTDLTHYVRSGHFVVALIRDSQDIYEYAFALGALCHYVADNTGHPHAVNRAVPILYPKLRAQYGNAVTFEDDPAAHVRTEFAFDVVQLARGHYASEDYHDFIGFQVSRPLLERAFKETYGIEMKSLFASLDLALANYRLAVSTIIPEMTKVAWELKMDEIQKQTPGITREKFLYGASATESKGNGKNQYEKPGIREKILANMLRVIPKIGPFKALAFKPVTPETEKLFLESVDLTTERYRKLLAEAESGRLRLEDTDFDTGNPTRIGEYQLADKAYARLLDKVAGLHDPGAIPPDLRGNILAFFDKGGSSAAGKKYVGDSRKTQRELQILRSAQAQTVGAAHR
jgi:hypothetical protein